MSATTNHLPPFYEFGEFLRHLRAPFYRSASAMCAEANFTFSYGIYSSYERGEALPSIPALLEITSFLKVVPKDSLLAWMRVQIPNEDLKKLFTEEGFSSERSEQSGHETSKADSQRYEISSNNIPAAEFDNTWIFSSFEKKIFDSNPWIMELLIHLSARYPEPISFTEMGINKTEEIDALIELCLSRWVEDGRIWLTAESISLVNPYIHAPKTDEWKEVRERQLKRAFKDLLPFMQPKITNQKKSHRTLHTRYLTEEQKNKIMDLLISLENTISQMPLFKTGIKSGDTKPYTLIGLLAERDITSE